MSGNVVVGAFGFPTIGEVTARIEALDKLITSLDADINASKAPRLDSRWREAWHAFVLRWQPFRDTYSQWTATALSSEVVPRLDAFEGNFRRWAREYQQRSNKRPTLVDPTKASDPITDLGKGLFWLGALGIAGYLFFSRGKR